MEKKTMEISVRGFVFTLVLMFFIGAALSGGLVYLLFGNQTIIQETKVYDTGDYEDYGLLEEIINKYEEYYIEEVSYNFV